MIKRLAFILLLLTQHLAESQNWGSVKGVLKTDFDLGNVEFVLTDSVHDELIVSSKFFKYVNGKYVRGICRWNGVRWDSLAGGINTHDVINVNPGGMAMSCIPYQGKLLVGGMFQSVGGVNATSLALWDGTKWDSLPETMAAIPELQSAKRTSLKPRDIIACFKLKVWDYEKQKMVGI